MKKDKIDSAVACVAIAIGIIVGIVSMEFLHIEPQWANAVVSLIISLASSFGVVYALIGSIVKFIIKKKNERFDISGKWYVVYHADYPKDHYLRIGQLTITQNFDDIDFGEFRAHTPVIENKKIVLNKYRDNEDLERTSIGSGYARIDRANSKMTGVYFITRGNQQSTVGLYAGNINKDSDRIEGVFTTTECAREGNKPIRGRHMMFRTQEAQTEYCNSIIAKSSEESE